MSIPRVIVRDLGDHADKKELVAVYSRFNSFRNVWVANNPPGFAYIFFDNMKDALKAVASTNGRHLCGGRVRVELTPIDEKEDNKRRMLSKGRMRRRNMRSPSPPRPRSDTRRTPSPVPPHQRGGIPRYISPRASPSPPIARHNRHMNSPSPLPPHPKRRSSQSGRHHYDDERTFRESPGREPIPRRPLPPPSPPPLNKAPLERKRDRGSDHHHYREGRTSRGSGSSDVSRSSGKFSARKDVHISRERYSSSRNVSLDSSPSDIGHFSHHHNTYEGSTSPPKLDRDHYDNYSHGKQHPKHFTSRQHEDNNSSPFYPDSGDPLPPAEFEYTTQTNTWTNRKRARYDYYEGAHHSPPPPPPPPQSRSVNHRRGSAHNERYKHFKDDQQQPPIHNDPGYGIQHEMNYHEQPYQHQRSLSPSPPPPPPPPPPPLQPSRRKSAKYDEGHSSVHHNESRGRKKGRDSGRHHHKHYHRRHGSVSPPPLYNNDNRRGHYTTSTNNQYRYMKHGDTEGAMCEQYQNKDTPSSPPRLKNQQYYEQIDEGTDGVFSEVGYHSPPQHSPSSHQLPYGINTPELLGIDGRPVTGHRQIDNNSFELQNEGADYDDSVDEHYLQIDEVKGSSDREEHGMVGGHAGQVYRSQKEREIVYNSGQGKDREVIHRKREREVIVKRSPERNRSRTPPISM